MSKKIYVLDTSALISGGVKTLYNFNNNDVIIPLIVIRELEKKRTDPDIGFIARNILKEIERLRVKYGNTLNQGVPTKNKGTIRIETNHITRPENFPASINIRENDGIILAVAKNIQDENPNQKVTLVSNDLPMRILAQVALRLDSVEFTLHDSQGDFTGIVEQDIFSENEINSFYNSKNNYSLTIKESEKFTDIPNIGVYAKNSGISAVKRGDTLKGLSNKGVSGLRPRSFEQKLAFEYLLDPNIEIVSLGGKAGTGKTLLALAAGIEQTFNKQNYNKVIVFRPLLAVGGQSLGYLPGNAEEKMTPWAGAVYDALDVLSSVNKNVNKIIDEDHFEILPITHIRGRTLSNTFVVIDEAQNLERNVLLSILSRVGENSKIILAWDAAQKDNLHIAKGDGIVGLVDRLKRESLFGHVTLSKTERGPVAELGSKILEEWS